MTRATGSPGPRRTCRMPGPWSNPCLGDAPGLPYEASHGRPDGNLPLSCDGGLCPENGRLSGSVAITVLATRNQPLSHARISHYCLLKPFSEYLPALMRFGRRARSTARLPPGGEQALQVSLVELFRCEA